MMDSEVLNIATAREPCIYLISTRRSLWRRTQQRMVAPCKAEFCWANIRNQRRYWARSTRGPNKLTPLQKRTRIRTHRIRSGRMRSTSVQTIFVFSFLSSSSSRLRQYSRSVAERVLTSSGVFGKAQKANKANKMVKTPSSKNIHSYSQSKPSSGGAMHTCHPCIPRSPSICSMAAARRPEKALKVRQRRRRVQFEFEAHVVDKSR
jgi:hypothetical protein